MDVINDIYLIVNLYGDTEKKYKIICRMGYFDTVIDVRTGRKIFIDGMYLDGNHPSLCCSNKFKAIPEDKAFAIIKNDDINDYNEYLDEIEKRNSKARKRVKSRK